MSHEFEFELRFAIPEGKWDALALTETVYEAGFHNATVGTGREGALRVNLADKGDGDDAEPLIMESLRALISRLPDGTRLHSVEPDLVSLRDVAIMMEIPRQYLEDCEMPEPAYADLYRIDEVGDAIEKAAKPKVGRRKPRVDASKAKGWFLAGRAARRINAKMALGLLDPVTLRDLGSAVPVTET